MCEEWNGGVEHCSAMFLPRCWELKMELRLTGFGVHVRA